MRKVKGKFHTKYGEAWFVMTKVDSAVLGIEGVWTINRVPYQGTLEVTCKPNKWEPEGWRHKQGASYINRADNVDKDVLSKSYETARDSLVNGFIMHVIEIKPQILEMVRAVEMDNERQALSYQIREEEKKLQDAKQALLEWGNNNSKEWDKVSRLLPTIDGDIEV